MNYLTDKADIEPGAVLKVYINNKFEGWARLLEQVEAKYSTFIDNNIVYVKERWRIQFVEPEEVPVEMAVTERFNQISLKGIITYRHFVYFGERTWELYIAKYGIPPEFRLDRPDPNALEEMDQEYNDDENFIF